MREEGGRGSISRRGKKGKWGRGERTNEQKLEGSKEPKGRRARNVKGKEGGGATAEQPRVDVCWWCDCVQQPWYIVTAVIMKVEMGELPPRYNDACYSRCPEQ